MILTFNTTRYLGFGLALLSASCAPRVLPSEWIGAWAVQGLVEGHPETVLRVQEDGQVSVYLSPEQKKKIIGEIRATETPGEAEINPSNEQPFLPAELHSLSSLLNIRLMLQDSGVRGTLVVDRFIVKQSASAQMKLGVARIGELPDTSEYALRKIEIEAYDTVLSQGLSALPIDPRIQAQAPANEESTGSFLPLSLETLELQFESATAVEVRRGGQTRPIRLPRTSPFPASISLRQTSFLVEVLSDGHYDEAVQLVIPLRENSEFSRARLIGLYPSPENPLVLTSQGMYHMRCSQWGVNSESPIFRSRFSAEGPDSALIRLNEQGTRAEVEFNCRVGNQNRRYTLIYTSNTAH
jgi:hypothetical protein